MNFYSVSYTSFQIHVQVIFSIIYIYLCMCLKYRASLETLNESRYSTESDIWSFGVTAWEIFSHGNMPWGEISLRDVRSPKLHVQALLYITYILHIYIGGLYL